MRRLLFNLILLLVVYLNCVNCLFEDQIGTYDWRQQYVGRPLYTRIDASKNRIFVATDQNLIAALNKKTGGIIWRKLFENSQYGQINSVLFSSREIIVVNGYGKHVQSFNYNQGFMNWEYFLFKQNLNEDSSIVGLESKVEAESHYLTNGNEVCYVNSQDKACVDLPNDAGYAFNYMVETDKGLFVIGVKDGSLMAVQYNALLSTIFSKKQLQFDWIKSNTNCFTVDSKFYCLSNGKLYLADLKATEFKFVSYKLPAEVNNEFKYVNSIGNSLLLKNNGDLVLLELKSDALTANIIGNFKDADMHYVAPYNSDKYLVVANNEGTKLTFKAYNLANGVERNDLIVTASLSEPRKLAYLDGVIFEAKAGQVVVNQLCLFEDYQLALFQHSGNKLFAREEALANIVSVEMVDFPLSKLQEEFEDEFGSSDKNVLMMLIKRIKSQISQLKELASEYYQLVTKSVKPQNRFQGVQQQTENKELVLARDEFNLNKLIVAVTAAGKVFGMHSSNGQIIWSFMLENSLPFEYTTKKTMPLFLQRSAAHYLHEAQCVIVSKSKQNNEQTILTFFNPLNGQRSKDYPKDVVGDFKTKQTFLANTADSHFLKPLIVFDNENKIHIYPKSAEALVLKSKNPYIVYIADKNSLNGYALTQTEKPLLNLWTINLDDETIISIGAKLPNDRIHSHGKVLGDRSVLYKYLNPNLIAVVTEGLDSQKAPFVNVYLVDTVNGNIITSFSHKRTKGPVHIVHSENWFFYSYFNMKYRRFEVTSVEIFEGSTQYNSTHFSSFDAIKPIIYTKSYITQKSFDAMQVTITEKGISTKDVIVACPFGTIIEIPWILIDARRPIEMTELEREENLIPYMPEIPLGYEFSLNYYNYVYNIRGIVTSPSGLESTSLVFAYGLDIFYTRVFPSKTFDMLREDFDYFFIITLMVGLLLGTIISKKMASASNLKKAWK